MSVPAKIRTELLDPITVDSDPVSADDTAYFGTIYQQAETAIQDDMDRLAQTPQLSLFG